ncbi:MAG: hypothetical protein MUC48_07310 [Leptolyngbya sp. Prado105]|jgi:hypothetical protein|nr:hypothetical protein [Leptolyngbya sp. Prado105]
MPKLHLISGLLGGMGKSLFARTMIHIHESRGISFTAFDADPQSYNVHKYYPHCTERMEISKSDFKSTDRVIQTLEMGTAIIVNLASSSGAAITAWFERDDLFNLLKEMGKDDLRLQYELVNWFLSDGSELSIDQFLGTVKQFELYADTMTHVLVRNLGKIDGCNAEGWTRMVEQEPLKPVFNASNVRSVEFPRFLKPEGFDGIEFTFAQAMLADRAGDGKRLNRLDRRRVIRFISDVEANVAALGLLDAPISKSKSKLDGAAKSS